MGKNGNSTGTKQRKGVKRFGSILIKVDTVTLILIRRSRI